MTAQYPYTPRYDNTHMWNISDIKGCYPKVKYCDTSIMGLLENNPDFGKFKYLVKLAKLDGQLNDPQANVTLFVASDRAIANLGDSWCINADLGWAFNLIRTSMVNRRITSELLTQSSAFWLLTRDSPNRLFISNISGKTRINNDVSIIHPDIQCSNGIIHVVDKLILPTWSGNQEK